MKQMIFLLFIISSIFVYAQDVQYGNNIIITQPVFEDLYLAGGNITINAPVHGDLVIAGGTIVINDTVTNDLLLVGGRVTLNGIVGDDVRCAGGDIRINKNIAGDLVVTGGRVFISNEVTIGNLLASGGTIIANGKVNGEVKGAFAEMSLNGAVAKSIDCRGEKITVDGTIGGKSRLAAQSIRIGDNAVFNNDVYYWNRERSVNFKESLKNGKAIYDPSLQMRSGEWYYLGFATLLGLLWYLAMALLMIMLIQYLFSSTVKKAAGTLFKSTLKSLGFGALFFLVLPVAAAVAFITVIGAPVGLLLLVSYLTLILLSSIIVSVVTANWLNNHNHNNLSYWRLVFVALGFFIILKLLASIPLFGWLIIILLVSASFGAILLNIRWKLNEGLPIARKDLYKVTEV